MQCIYCSKKLNTVKKIDKGGEGEEGGCKL